MIQRIPVTALALETSADGVARGGASVFTNALRPGTLSCLITASMLTLGVKARFAWQATVDGVNWVEVSGGVSTPNVYTSTSGDGVAPIVRQRVMYLDWQGFTSTAFQAVRMTVTLSRTGVGPVPAPSDVAGARYFYVPAGKV